MALHTINMFSKITSGAVIGLQTRPVEVEVDVSNYGMPRFNIVGLPDKAVEEAKERVRSAIKNSQAGFPEHRITVNLAPADLPKVGPAYDLPIAIGILIASGEIRINPEFTEYLFIGELSLDGTVRHTNGILPLSIMARELGLPGIFIPQADAAEASVVSQVQIFPVSTLTQLVEILQGRLIPEPLAHQPFQSLFSQATTTPFDFADIKGQEQAKRAAEIAAAGHHNLFLRGMPGAGKTMLARALPSIMPPLTEVEALEVTKIYSVTGLLKSGQSLITERTFSSPHHTTSQVGLIGGGSYPSPGEISLAHRGVLFLDELPEFSRAALESLRQPLEDGVVTISRAAGTIQFPAKFLLIAAANPCPCGYYQSPTHQCSCPPGQIQRYQKKISGPLLDRIDLHVHVAAVDVKHLSSDHQSENSASIRQRVSTARQHQQHRFNKTQITANGEMNSQQVRKYCLLDSSSQSLLNQAVDKLGLTARSYFRVIKLARTIADLSDEEQIKTDHLAEALQFRPAHKVH